MCVQTCWPHITTAPTHDSDDDAAQTAALRRADMDPTAPEYVEAEDRTLKIDFRAPVRSDAAAAPTSRIIQYDGEGVNVLETGTVATLRPPDAGGVEWVGTERNPGREYGGREVTFLGPDGEREPLWAHTREHCGHAALVYRLPVDEQPAEPGHELVEYRRRTIIGLDYLDREAMGDESELIVPSRSWVAWTVDERRVAERARAAENPSTGESDGSPTDSTTDHSEKTERARKHAPQRPVHAEAIAEALADPDDPTWTRDGPEAMPDDADVWRTHEPVPAGEREVV
jgi:hypothetical protein